MPAMKVWDGTAWQTVSQGPPGAFPVTSVDGRGGAVSLSDLYVSATDPFVMTAGWTAYTPVFATESNPSGAGMTPGSGGFVIGAYRMIAPYTMAIRVRFQWGSTGGNGGGGNHIFSLPAGYGSAVDTYQYMPDVVYRPPYSYSGFAHVFPNDPWMRPCAPNAATIQDVVGSQQQIHTDGTMHPPSYYPSGVCGIWGVLAVIQRT